MKELTMDEKMAMQAELYPLRFLYLQSVDY